MASDTDTVGGARQGERLRDRVHGGTYFLDVGDPKVGGGAVVLIHGVGLAHRMWDAQEQAFASRLRVVRYDMLGHGRSANPPGERNVIDFVHQLDQLLMNLNFERASLVGFSMGGLVARAFAGRHPERVERLVLVSTVYNRLEAERAAVRARYAAAEAGGDLTEAALRRWFSPEFAEVHPEAVAAVRGRLQANDRDGYLRAYRVIAEAYDAEEDLAAIACPSLVITGELDSSSTPAMARAMAAELPNAEALILPGLRHMVPIEGSGVLNRALLAFLT